MLHLYRCNECQSYFFDGENPASSYRDLVISDEFWIDYVQAGAGITSMLAPLFAVKTLNKGSLIDVGCGFGFVVHYWQSLGHSALGLEDSYYGNIGEEKLGVTICRQYLGEYVRENPGREFEIVYSSEVIEHTSDPGAFVQQLCSLVSEDGIIILTTPCTNSISEQANHAALNAALSPGFHYGIISQQAMKSYFSQQGFHCHFETTDTQMITWAGKRSLPEVTHGRFDWHSYFTYLGQLADHPDPHICSGALHRLFKDSLNTNHPEIAATAYPRLLEVARKHYGIDLENPEVGEMLKSKKQLYRLAQYPSWLGNCLLFGAIHVGHARNDRRTKLRMLDAALKVLRHRMEVDAQFGQEAAHYYPFAERQYIIGLSEALTVSLNRNMIGEGAADLHASLSVLKEVLTELLP
ncbi:MAG: methyltransferase domain-containing protein [Syntrophobacter sp.]